MIQVKFFCNYVNLRKDIDEKSLDATHTVYLNAVKENKPDSANSTWVQALLGGVIQMTMLDKGCCEKLKQGKTYLLTFDEIAS